MVSNTATVTSSATDTNLANNSATQATTISPPAPGSADLSIALADAPDPVAIGMPLTYTMTVANAGPDPATGVEAVVTLPAGVTFVSASGSGWTCTQVTTTISCALAGSLSGTAAAVSLVVDAPSTQGSVEVEGVVTGTTSDPSFANNTAIADTEVFDPALQNHPPTLSLPTGLTTPENTALVLDASSAPTIADPDAGSDAVQLTVQSSNCVFSLGTISGLTIVTGDGVLDPLLVARGSIAQLNAALVGATITPVPSFSGQAQLSIVVNDLGHNGAGGPMSVSGTLSVKVAFVDMPPTANNDTVSVSANSMKNAIDVLANDKPGNVGQKLTVATVGKAQHGTTSLSSDGSVILYTPAFDYVGADQVTYSITDGTYTASAQVAITVVGDAQTNGIGLRGGGLGCAFAARSPDASAWLALCAVLFVAFARRNRTARRSA
jgi:large repetitive protein